MTIVYVGRDGGGAIRIVARVPQPGQAEEPIDDAAAEVVAFLNPVPPTDGDRAVGAASVDPFSRAMVKLLAQQSAQIFGATRTVPQVIAILKSLA